MTTFSIYYMRPSHFRDGICGDLPDPNDIDRTHVHVKDIELDGNADQLGAIFLMMQAERWSPNGEARPLIEAKGLQHTSMSVGDVIKVTGRTHVVANIGFKEI